MINTAVHGKASRGNVLLADGASAKKNGDDDRDKTNTVDFGATLTAIIDQAGLNQAAATKDPGVSDATASPAAASRTDGPTTFEANALDFSDAATGRHFTKLATSPKSQSESGSESPAPASTAKDSSALETRAHDSATEIDPYPSSARNEPVAGAGNDRTATIDAASNPHQLEARADTDEDLAPSTSPSVTSSDRTDQPAAPPIGGEPGVEVAVDSAVPDSDIALYFRKQIFPSTPADESAHASADHFSASAIPATVANSAQTKAEADIAAAPMPGTTNSPHPHLGRANDGTPSALSSQNTSLDSMNPANSKITQTSLATLAIDATSSSAQQASPTQMDVAAQFAPQDQRDRSVDGKEISTPTAAPAATPNKEAHSIDTQPASRAAETAPIRAAAEVASPREASRTVSITVQLAGGQSARASVRERAGAVDVKILTPTAAAAQRVSSEMDGMRQNLDAAGIKLGHSEISYQQGDGGGGQGREGYRPPAQNASANGKDVFYTNEVIQ